METRTGKDTRQAAAPSMWTALSRFPLHRGAAGSRTSGQGGIRLSEVRHPAAPSREGRAGRRKAWGRPPPFSLGLPLLASLLLALAAPAPGGGGDAVRERAQANDAMNALRQAAAAGDASVPDALLAVARDSARDGGVREYAVQHLGAWMRAGHDAARVEQMLWELADDPVAGTAAILQLHHAGGPSLRGGRAWADLLARRMDRDGLRDAEKATLLLVAAESGVPAALPHARDWAAATSDTVLLRCALQTLGRLGSRADVAFLDRMAEEKPLGEATETWEKARRQLAEGPMP